VVVLATLMLVLSASPALAIAGGGGQDGVKDPQRVEPGGDRGKHPDHAADPTTGRLNKDHETSNCQAAACQ
jgi:hypothetical protein